MKTTSTWHEALMRLADIIEHEPVKGINARQAARDELAEIATLLDQTYPDSAPEFELPDPDDLHAVVNYDEDPADPHDRQRARDLIASNDVGQLDPELDLPIPPAPATLDQVRDCAQLAEHIKRLGGAV